MFGSLRGEGGSGRGKNEGLWEERALGSLFFFMLQNPLIFLLKFNGIAVL
jgi:hypothetical protein